MNNWEITFFDANDNESKMYVTATDVQLSANRHGFCADDVHFEFEYEIISIVQYKH